MPTLKVKTKYIDKLKALGCYDKWLANVKDQWGTAGGWSADVEYTNFNDVIYFAFTWFNTPEGQDFWADISNK